MTRSVADGSCCRPRRWSPRPCVARAAGPDTVRFGVLHPNLTTVIHEIAKRTGAYERQNLKVVETRFKSGQTVEGVEQLWRGNLDFYMGGAPEVPRLNSRLIEAGSPPPLAVVSGANPGHTSLVLGNKLQPKTIDEILKQPLRIAVSSLSSVHLAFFRGYLITEKKLELQGHRLAASWASTAATWFRRCSPGRSTASCIPSRPRRSRSSTRPATCSCRRRAATWGPIRRRRR